MIKSIAHRLAAIAIVACCTSAALGQWDTAAGGSTASGVGVAADPVLGPVRLCAFEIDGAMSQVQLSLFPGGFSSPLDGELVLRLGDPSVPTPGNDYVGVSVRKAVFLATAWTPENNFLDEPMILLRDPVPASVGWYRPTTGEISVVLYLVKCNGPAPVPMPLRLRGELSNSELRLRGDNGPVSDASMAVRLVASKVHRRADIRYSTEISFPVPGTGSVSSIVSDGDLLSELTCVFKRNHELTARLGIMPPAPDLGLDAVTLTGYRPIFFSLEESVFSETLGWLDHGDLLSITGRIVRTNEELMRAFGPFTSDVDFGLDAVHVLTEQFPSVSTADCCGCIFFSTETRFYSGALNRWVGHGDLLCEGGCVYRTNRQLLANFHPVAIPCPGPAGCAEDPLAGNEGSADEQLYPCISDTPDAHCIDFGLDAVYFTATGEIWFSTEIGFYDANLGWVSDGDVLSTRGYIVRQNLRLVDVCEPLIDIDNFGLDALDRVTPLVNITPVEVDQVHHDFVP